MFRDRGTEIMWASVPWWVFGVILWKQIPGPHFEFIISRASVGTEAKMAVKIALLMSYLDVANKV